MFGRLLRHDQDSREGKRKERLEIIDEVVFCAERVIGILMAMCDEGFERIWRGDGSGRWAEGARESRPPATGGAIRTCARVLVVVVLWTRVFSFPSSYSLPAY